MAMTGFVLPRVWWQLAASLFHNTAPHLYSARTLLQHFPNPPLPSFLPSTPPPAILLCFITGCSETPQIVQVIVSGILLLVFISVAMLLNMSEARFV